MINNLNILKEKSVLKFPDEDTYYYLMVCKRKKDQEKPENHQSARLIREYYITSMEYLDSKMEEIITLCEATQARAYIDINPNSFRTTSYEALELLAKRLKEGNHNNQQIFQSASGRTKPNKYWILDVDTKDWMDLACVTEYVDLCRPVGPDKIITAIPTKQGYHLITKKFDQKKFQGFNTGVEILKKSPTLLYYPNSLHESIKTED